MKYTFTAVLSPKESGNGFYCRVPDLPGCITTGKDLSDAVEQITDAASIWLVDAEDDERAISAPSDQVHISHEPDDVLTLIQIDTLAYRSLIDTRAVRKNVSLPAWLSNMADKKGINCSQVLQEALKVRLGA